LRKKEKIIVTTKNIKSIIQINLNLLTRCIELSISLINGLIIEISITAVNPSIFGGNDNRETVVKIFFPYCSLNIKKRMDTDPILIPTHNILNSITDKAWPYNHW